MLENYDLKLDSLQIVYNIKSDINYNYNSTPNTYIYIEPVRPYYNNTRYIYIPNRRY